MPDAMDITKVVCPPMVAPSTGASPRLYYVPDAMDMTKVVCPPMVAPSTGASCAGDSSSTSSRSGPDVAKSKRTATTRACSPIHNALMLDGTDGSSKSCYINEAVLDAVSPQEEFLAARH